MSTLAGILTILATVLPPLLLHWREERIKRNVKKEALVDRSVSELDAGYDQLRGKPPVPP